MFRVKIPATTANLGPGFDTLGLALSIYNYITIEESDQPLTIEIKNSQGNSHIPVNENNLIYITMKSFYEETGLGNLPNIKITQEDYIPMTRGLGSSAACIVGGLIAANELSGLKLSKDDLAYMAAKIEGHPDNSTPAIMGGFVVGTLTSKELKYIKLEVKNLDELSFAVMIPDFQLQTEEARDILPSYYSRNDAVFNVSRVALLVAALTTGDFDKLKIAMDDKLHQPYRKKIIDNMEDIFIKSKKLGAKAAFLSGAGPTLIAVSTDKSFIPSMSDYLSGLKHNWKLYDIRPDLLGAQIEIFGGK